MEEQVSELEMAQKTTDLEKEKLQKEELSKSRKSLRFIVILLVLFKS